MSNLGKPKGAKKKTKAELAAMAEMDAKARLKARFAKAKEERKEVSEELYAAAVDVKNENRDNAVDASGVDAAVDALKGLSTSGGSGSFGTTNMKAAYAAFEEVELPRLKEENPRLKMSQYKEQLAKMWRQDPRTRRISQRRSRARVVVFNVSSRLPSKSRHCFLLSKGFGMDAFAFSANPRNAPMDLFTGDLAAAALYSAASRSSCCGRRCMAPTC